MSDMKCPFCQQEYIITKDDSCFGQQRCVCRNPNCEFDGWHFPVKLVAKLIRTRKALEIAVDALKRANNTYCAEEEDITIDLTESAAHKWQRTAYQMEMPISIALEQIKELEQKDKQC